MNGSWRGYWYATLFDSTGLRTKKHRSQVLGPQNEMTKSEAKKKLAGIIAEQEGDQPDGTITLRFWIETRWLPLKKAAWKKSTAGTNDGIIQNQIIKPLGSTPITGFDKVRLQAHLNDLALTHSYSIVQHTSSFLKSMFEEMVEADLLVKNPARTLKIPKIKPYEEEILGYGDQFFLDGKPYVNADQLRALLSTLEGRNRLIAMLAGLMGLRGGEVLALQWDCWTGSDLVVLRRVYRGEVASVKTRASVAILPVPKIIKEALDKLKASTPRPYGFIFETRKFTPLSRDNFLRRVLDPASYRAKIPFTVDFQILRRSFATLFAGNGASYAEVETMMRHEKSDIHLVYVQGQRDSILKILDKMCDSIASGLPEHVDKPKKKPMSKKAAETIRRMIDQYGLESSEGVAQVRYDFPQEPEKKSPEYHGPDRPYDHSKNHSNL